jgi:putative spermidine/putrescine transport system substrate-binding protein/spermidine/putrescine transport system substrate-binding protein
MNRPPNRQEEDMTIRLNRRAVLGGTAGLAAALAAPAILRAQGRELRLLTWEGYAEPEWLDPFKAATGAAVSIAYAGSADEMFARMQGSKGADFDLVSFDTSLFPRYIDGGLIVPFDPGQVPNMANLAPEFQNVAATMRDGKHFGVPFAWGSLPMIYDADAFPTAPESWEAMWDPAHAQRVLCMDDANNCITLGGLILGVADPFNLTAADMAAIRDKYLALKPNLLSWYAGFDEGAQLFAQNGVVVMYSMGEPQVKAIRDQGVNAALTIPKEGAIGWLDCWEVSAGVKDADLAHAWINACLDKATGQALTEKLGYGNTTNAEINTAAGLTYGDQLTWLQTAENYEARVALWNEIKAA